MLKIKIVNKSSFEEPKYATNGSAGFDVRANITEPITIGPMERTLVPTGLFFELPQGFEAQIRPRSGLAFKYGVTVLNSPGTLDSDYRGECKVLLVNLSNDEFVINPGERIAQIIISKHETVEFEVVSSLEELTDTSRGAGGFGSTGKH